MSDPQFAELLDAYWSAAYMQGKGWRNHDDKEGSAQIAESNLCHYVDSLRSELILAESAFDAVNEKLSTARAEGRREGLEEAAKVADKHGAECLAKLHKKRSDHDLAVFESAATEAQSIAAAIRAKIEETKL